MNPLNLTVLKSFRLPLYLVCILTLLIISCTSGEQNGNTSEYSKQAAPVNISAEEAYRLISDSIENNDLLILDLRTGGEYRSGAIENSINIDYYSGDFRKQLSLLDKNKRYLIYCRSGSRSASALNIMKELGFRNIYNLRNGIQDWYRKGYQIKKNLKNNP